MTESAFELVTLRCGATSILSRVHGETMHIGTDPGTEALELHLRQQRVAERVAESVRSDPFVIWDVGLGPAANAITAIEALRDGKKPVEIHSFEISTEVLEFALNHSQSLGYLAGWESVVGELLSAGSAYPTPEIRWVLHRGDFSRDETKTPAPSAIFFDPYSPARNAEMWSLEIFQKLWQAVSAPEAPSCTMTSYTRSTAVRTGMALAGWFVGAGVPTGEKTETTIAANHMELLARPLGIHWLERVRASTNGAPIRGSCYEKGPISPEDFARLKALPQFSC